MKKYWMVHNPKGGPAHAQHTTLAAANHEAERLARANPGQHFVVLESLYHVTVNDIKREPMQEREPFQLIKTWPKGKCLYQGERRYGVMTWTPANAKD